MYVVETPLLLENSSFSIVHVSDLHSVIYGNKQELLIDKINSLNPDLVLLTGDIFDDYSPVTGTQLFLAGVSGIAPVYFVTGNHEYRSRRLMEIDDLLKQYKIQKLSDEYVFVKIGENEIVLAGIEDIFRKIYINSDYDQDSIMETRFRELDDADNYKILLAHRPERIDSYKRFSFSMILSGHTHGGQIRIPYLINGLFAPDQGFFPKYGGGLYQHNNLVHIINRGLFIHPMLPRIFNPPEICFITVKSSKQEND